MAARKEGSQERPRQVRKSLMVDAGKLDKARKLLGTTSDSETLRVALDHLLSHAEDHTGEQE